MNIIQIIAMIEVVIILLTVILTIVKEDYEKKKRCNLKVKGIVRDRWTEEYTRTQGRQT